MLETALFINIIILIALILFSAFFSCSETALFSLSRARLLNYRKDRSRTRKTIIELLDSYHTTLIALILANMFVNTGIAIVNEHIMAAANLGTWITRVLSIFITVVILLVLGEVIPKTIALINADKVSDKVALPVLLIKRLLSPVVLLVEKISSFILDLIGRRKIVPLTAEEYSSYLEMAGTSGAFSRAEMQLLNTALELREKLVAEVMTGRIETCTIPRELSPEEVVKIIRREKREFFPIVKQDIDDTEHFLSARGFFLLPEEERRQWAHSSGVFSAISIPDNTSLTLALTSMRRRKIPAALTVDEYGRVSGMITSKDIYSVMVGNINGPYKTPDFDIQQLHEQTWIIDGMMPLYTFEEVFKVDIPDEFESNTLNGLFCEVIGRIPAAGDEIIVFGIKMLAENVEHHCVKRMRVELLPREDKS
ncbi:MAG: hemolysin family protein [Victivallaceae bacterium]|jgi:CBS domain containing-hemolysin-like protein